MTEKPARKPVRKKALTLVAAQRPQLKKRARRDWSKAKAAAFLGVLAETCNVSEACRRSGVPMTVAYRRRKMDAAFRAAWIEAIGGSATIMVRNVTAGSLSEAIVLGFAVHKAVIA